MGKSKRKKQRRKKNNRRLTLIIIPALLILCLVFFFTLKPPVPEKPENKGVRLPMPGISTPMLALIIDDGGYNMEYFENMLGMGKRMTFAILPDIPHTREAALKAYEDGAEVMLHLPMEPKEGEKYSLEKETVRTGMDPMKIQKIVKGALNQIPHVRGVNNHMGSKATEDPQVMGSLMEVLKKEGLYFIDSNTSPHTIGPEMAHRAGIAVGRNDQFIDNEKNIKAIKEAIRLAIRKAKQEGKAVAIGHPHPLTAQAIKDMIPEIEKEGIRLVFASEVVR
ncbi:MAG: divergent polysaccharide deacetylase family protein [Deltaproteobacteria bacterium]|nr:divergent polysaccharide deacetylase family protein [Deltaproteobacteria bacterium]